MEKLKMSTRNLTNENYEKLVELFPNVVTEIIDDEGNIVRAIDKDILMQEINTHVIEARQERYQFIWPDKNRTIIASNTPTNNTLRPCIEESLNFDTTENLYIEGDNLEVLKVLKETYLGKIKCIYIDPPYNTGNDFVYNDNFIQTRDDYLVSNGQFDVEGNRLEKNLESSGRFHTNWLNMMYSRIKLAKNLLSDDGVVFISIDDNEQANCKKICDEILGEKNFIDNLIVTVAPAGTQSSKYIAHQHAYCLVYVKNESANTSLVKINLSNEEIELKYSEEDTYGKYYTERIWKRGIGGRKEDVPSLHFPVWYNKETDEIYIDEEYKGDSLVKIIPYQTTGVLGRWTWSKEKMKKERNKLKVRMVNGEWKLYKKVYSNEEKGVLPRSIIESKIGRTELGSKELKEIFDKKLFDYPKFSELIKSFFEFSTDKDSIILDFFSGSATTAHAVMQLNAEDGGNRKFIMVQLPEATDEKSEAYKAGYKYITEIGKERIRRASKKILEENKDKEGIENLDIGFRVLKLDSSNMKDIYYTPQDTQQSMLEDLTDNIKEDRNELDLLFQVMLDLGVELSSTIDKIEISGKKIFSVADNYLLATFDKDIDDEIITEIAKKRPVFFVMRDASLTSDSVATNFEQIFNTYSPETTRRVL